jgi:hypothetical protein
MKFGRMATRKSLSKCHSGLTPNYVQIMFLKVPCARFALAGVIFIVENLHGVDVLFFSLPSNLAESIHHCTTPFFFISAINGPTIRSKSVLKSFGFMASDCALQTSLLVDTSYRLDSNRTTVRVT